MTHVPVDAASAKEKLIVMQVHAGYGCDASHHIGQPNLEFHTKQRGFLVRNSVDVKAIQIADNKALERVSYTKLTISQSVELKNVNRCSNHYDASSTGHSWLTT